MNQKNALHRGTRRSLFPDLPNTSRSHSPQWAEYLNIDPATIAADPFARLADGDAPDFWPGEDTGTRRAAAEMSPSPSPSPSPPGSGSGPGPRPRPRPRSSRVPSRHPDRVCRRRGPRAGYQ